MAFSRNVWDQLKSLTAGRLIRALEKDGWAEEDSRGATRGFVKDDRRLVIHYHPRKTYGSKLLKELIKTTCWTENDLEKLQLIKKVQR